MMLNPTLDLVFKILLTRHLDILVPLLTAVLRPPIPIDSVVVLNPEIDRVDVGDRGIVLDIRVRLASGMLIDVEMQSRNMGSTKRTVYHWARLYASQIHRGDPYSELEPCVCVFILDCNQLPSKRFHSTFELIEVHDHDHLSDQVQIHLVELPKLPAMGTAQAEAEPELVLWAKFFRARTEAEFEELAMTDPTMRKAVDYLRELSADAKMRELASDREEALKMYQLTIAEERAKGRVEGKAEIVETLLRERFGSLDKQTSERILAATPDQLERWVRRVLCANSLQEVLDASDP